MPNVVSVSMALVRVGVLLGSLSGTLGADTVGVTGGGIWELSGGEAITE